MSEETPDNKAAFAVILNPRLSKARHNAVVEGLPALISAFGLSFTGQIYKHDEDENGGERVTPLYGYLTPLEGDPDTKDSIGFTKAITCFILVVKTTPLSNLFVSMACMSCSEDNPNPLGPMVVTLTRETIEMLNQHEEGGD